MATITNKYPKSGIKRINVISSVEASSFLDKWPVSLHQEELKYSQSVAIEQTFHEKPTRNAFSSVSTQLHGIVQLINAHTSDLSVIKRRTEQFSPSKPSRTLNIEESGTSRTRNYDRELQPIAPVPPILISKAVQEPQRHLPAPGSTPLIETPLGLTPILAPIVVTEVIVPPAANGPAPAPIPQITTVGSKSYIILPLSVSRTQYDLILPPPGAFQASVYPSFAAADCTWNSVFAHIVDPSLLWTVYAPDSLGNYPDIKSLWQAWDEGSYVENVGRKPALRLLDARWGSLKNMKTNKGKFPSWRPRNDNNVRLSLTLLSNWF